jgi:PHD/YefM family antitoxin component YafN of YafNO toxin-antitoxin module
MKAQIIEKRGKKEFAVVPYEDFVRMQEEIEDYHDLRDLRRAKADPRNQEGRSFESVAKDLGLKKKKAPPLKQR